MKRYLYTRTTATDTALDVDSNSKAVIDAVKDTLMDVYEHPRKAVILYDREEFSLFTLSMSMKPEIGPRYYEAGWLVLSRLLQDGWEPFATNLPREGRNDIDIHLRYLVEQESEGKI